MKANIVNIIVSVIISGLIFWVFYASCEKLLYTLPISLSSLLMLVCSIGLVGRNRRIQTNVAVVSMSVLIILLLVSILAAMFSIKAPVFALIYGVVFSVWLIIYAALIKKNNRE